MNRSAFYAWKSLIPTIRSERDRELLPLVRSIFHKHRRRYGARRIADELHDLGHTCGRPRVSKLMKNQGLRAIQPKSFKPRTTESKHRLGYSPNLLLEADEITEIDQLWVGDITYIPIALGRFSYLAMLMDRFSRRIIGWHLGEDMTEALVLKTLRQAIRRRAVKEGLIHHTDRGGQYAGGKYRKVLSRAAMCQSMSRADNCYDNAFMESCFGTLKNELEMTSYDSHHKAVKEISVYIRYYNLERKHSSLGYLSPIQFETNLAAQN